MMNDERIIEKIKKVLELSRNNPSEEEAKAAALKAQRLMAEYHISMADVDTSENLGEITETSVHAGTGNKWKYSLAGIVAKNFRCRTFVYGKSDIVFYGYEVDTKIAAETFKFLFDTGNKAANNYYSKLRNSHVNSGKFFDGKGVKNCFLIGYIDGIRESLEKQCTALMIVVPKEVSDQFKERTASAKRINSTMKARSYYANQSYEYGRNTGRDTIGSRKLAMA